MFGVGAWDTALGHAADLVEILQPSLVWILGIGAFAAVLDAVRRIMR